MAKSSWRFLFVDVNKSITIQENETQWIGFMSIRAPKGNTSADFIAPDNADLIKSMYGYPSADWPDIYDAIEFNKNYGVYLSASPGTSNNIPNYYGGYYLTNKGLLKMYCNTSKTKPNYEVAVKPGKVSQTLNITSNESLSTVSLNEKGKQATIVISNLPAFLIRNTDELAFNFWNKTLPFRYKLDKKNNLVFPSSYSVSSEDGQKIACGKIELKEDGTYLITLGGDSTSNNVVGYNWNTKSDEENYGIPFIDFTTYNYDYSELYNEDFDTWKETSDSNTILSCILNGTKSTVDNDTIDVSYSKPLSELFRFVFNCKDITKSYIIQKSPTAQETNVTISNVVFDKYSYDEKVYFTLQDVDSENKANELFPKTGDDLYKKLIANETTENPVIVSFGSKTSSRKVFEYITSEDDNENEVSSWKDVTNNYVTTKFLLIDTILNVEKTKEVQVQKDDSEETEAQVIKETVKEEDSKDLTHSIIYVSESDLYNLQDTNNTNEIKDLLKENIDFNTFTMTATEVDEEGEVHTVGPFTGSLDETALDSNGSDYFWEDIYPADSASYVEVYVNETFDEDLDTKGYYTGVRFDSSTVSLDGQRYIDKVVEDNIANGNTGCNVVDASTSIQKQFAKIAKESMIEAANPKYEDASLFMETTGLDSVRNYFSSIRTNHKMATIISPKNITEDVFNNINKLTLQNRLRGSAVYCQELQFKDKNSRKKYYTCPIGAVGSMLMRIMENYYGGVAPAWLNNNSVGGQLDDFFIDRTPIKARWDFTDTDTKVMDEKGVNPIVFDVDDGVMITSQKTTELDAGDWSYLGHSMAFDLCKREIRDNVMKPQIQKKINDYWIDVREGDTEKILRKRTTGTDPIWSEAIVNIKDVNTEYTKAQRIFNISVKVKVYPFSEYVKLEFKNVSQITEVSD